MKKFVHLTKEQISVEEMQFIEKVLKQYDEEQFIVEFKPDDGAIEFSINNNDEVQESILLTMPNILVDAIMLFIKEAFNLGYDKCNEDVEKKFSRMQIF